MSEGVVPPWELPTQHVDLVTPAELVQWAARDMTVPSCDSATRFQRSPSEEGSMKRGQSNILSGSSSKRNSVFQGLQRCQL